MSWNYRIIEYTRQGYTLYRLAEVHYHKDGVTPRAWTTDEYSGTSGLEGLDSFQFYFEKAPVALTKPVLVEQELEGGRSTLTEKTEDISLIKTP